MSRYETVIGLEVHAQLLTQSKAFCGCSTRFGDRPNRNTCPVCLGLPGALPVLNREAVVMAVKTALALGCTVHRKSVFARKNYFYPDMPKGYQISQYEHPLSSQGSVEIPSGERNAEGTVGQRCLKRFGIRRVHLEEDAGKSLHPENAAISRIDLNRAGIPLVEIVSEPDLRTSQEANDYMSHLRKTLLYLQVCDGNMEEGSLRCDANISLRPRGETRQTATRVEIKNLNSFRFLQRALDYEAERQESLLRSGKTVRQETRLWDERARQTFPLRTKEDANDYRYFPEPDLPPLEISPEWLAEIRQSLPELPEARRKRFQCDYSLEEEESLQLTATPATADYFESVIRAGICPKTSSHWILGDLTAEWKRMSSATEDCPVPAGELAILLRLVDTGEISGKMAKIVLAQMFQNREGARAVLQRLGLVQISDDRALLAIVHRVLAENIESVKQYRSGKEKLFGFFIGQTMKQSGGQANPQKLNQLLRQELSHGEFD